MILRPQIIVLAQVRVELAVTLPRTFIYSSVSRSRQLDNASMVSEQTKAVLDRLGRAKVFLQTIVDLGAIASDVGS